MACHYCESNLSNGKISLPFVRTSMLSRLVLNHPESPAIAENHRTEVIKSRKVDAISLVLVRRWSPSHQKLIDLNEELQLKIKHKRNSTHLSLATVKGHT